MSVKAGIDPDALSGRRFYTIFEKTLLGIKIRLVFYPVTPVFRETV